MKGERTRTWKPVSCRTFTSHVEFVVRNTFEVSESRFFFFQKIFVDAIGFRLQSMSHCNRRAVYTLHTQDVSVSKLAHARMV